MSDQQTTADTTASTFREASPLHRLQRPRAGGEEGQIHRDRRGLPAQGRQGLRHPL